MSGTTWEKLPDEPGELLHQASSSGSEPQDIMALVQWVLREAYLENLEELRDHLNNVRYYNRMKKAMREHIRELRAASCRLAGVALDEEVEAVTVLAFRGSMCEDRPIIEVRHVGEARTAASLDEYIEALQGQFDAFGDDAEMALLDLQSELQRLQQTVQMMSNLNKMSHETAMAAIRNRKS